jgi:hypothetical protein
MWLERDHRHGGRPASEGKSRNPDEIAAEITAIADENNCDS